MKTETENKPVDLSRRRLAKGGLAVPIVLASIASKNVLANVPYRCTISGKLSGGSTHSTTDSCDLGTSGRNRLASLNNTSGSGARKLSDLYPSGQLTSAYDFKSSSFRIVAADPFNTAKRATIYQILAYGAGSPTPPNLGYAKKALALYLNAEELNGASGVGHDNYPLNTTEAKDIFNAIVAGSGYSGTTSAGPFNWTNAEVRQYVDLLYF